MRAVFLMITAGAALAQVGGPAPASPSLRLEDWGRLRTAAAPILGWRVGTASSFRQLTFFEAAERTDALGLGSIQGFHTQKVSLGIPKYLNCDLAPGEVTAVKDKLRALNLRMPAYFTDDSSSRKVFEFAKSLGVETIVSNPKPESLAEIDKLANEFGVNVALSDRRPLEGRSKRIGYWIQEIGPLDRLKDRLLVVNLGSGATGLPEFIREMYRLELKPLFLTVDPSGIEALEKALQPVMADRVGQMSRAAAIRGPERVTPEERQKIEAALPQKAPAKPRKPRKLLVMDLNVAYPGHRSIAHLNLALDLMGRKTGAYETVFSNDLDNLKYDKVRQFDAIYLNNTVGMIFVDPEVRQGLTRFVREGGGLAGNHGTSHASMDWPEFGEMIGTTHGVHREPTEQATVKIDDPKSPLTAAFGGKEFVYQDEFFRFPDGPYSRDKLHVLLSMDVEKTDMNQGRACPAPCVRPDNDYAISWIRSYGKGRVFFCILGHNPTLAMTPALAEYFLAGIQFILGDLEADTTPSARLGQK